MLHHLRDSSKLTGDLYSYFCICPQIGCFMGFSITACIIAGIMFICYCVALQDFSHITHCTTDDIWWGSDAYCYSRSERNKAVFGLKVGSCQLIFSMVVFIVALTSSIYCCKAVCCGVPPVGMRSVSCIL